MSRSLSDLMTRQSMKALRNAIRHAIDKYDNSWIVIHETVQNSIDAIDANERVDSGHIHITFDLDSYTVEIEDNGVGFPHEEELIIPNLGTKDSQVHSKGYSGIGLKAVVFSSSYFRINSIHDEKIWGIEIKNAYEFLNGIDKAYDLIPDSGKILSGKPIRKHGTKVCQKDKRW